MTTNGENHAQLVAFLANARRFKNHWYGIDKIVEYLG